jgi:hypothetical protein
LVRVLLGVLALAFILAGTSVLYARAGQHDLERARAAVSRAKDRLEAFDARGADAALAEAARAADDACAHLGALPLGAMARVPYAGRSVRAARALAAATRTVVAAAARGLIAARPVLDATHDGTFDLAGAGWPALERATQDAADSFAAALRSVASSPSALVLPSIRRARASFGRSVSDAQRSAARLALGARVAGGLLGARGARDSLFVIENGAEVRALGGAPNSFVSLRASNGHVGLVRTEDDAKLPPREFAVAFRITTDPDFPSVARATAALYRRVHGENPGSIAYLDGTALGYLLAVTGPIDIGSERIAGSNVAAYLARDIYLRHPSLSDRQLFNATLARTLFDRLLHGHPNLRALATGLSRAARERHVVLWSADATEARALDALGISGRFEPRAAPNFFALIGNSPYNNKLGTWERRSIVYRVRLAAGGGCTARADVEWTNDVDPRLYPAHVAGAPPGVVRSDVDVWFGARRSRRHVDVPPSSRVARAFSAPCVANGGSFEVVFWHQPRLNPDSLRVVVESPAGTTLEGASGFTRSGDSYVWSGDLSEDRHFTLR